MSCTRIMSLHLHLHLTFEEDDERSSSSRNSSNALAEDGRRQSPKLAAEVAPTATGPPATLHAPPPPTSACRVSDMDQLSPPFRTPLLLLHTTSMAPIDHNHRVAAQILARSAVAVLAQRDLTVKGAQGVTLGVIAAYVVGIAILWNIPYLRYILWPFKVRRSSRFY